MARFNSILMEKVEQEEKEEKKQELLKQRTGIEDDDVVLKEKGAADYFKSVLKGIGYVVFVGLVFIGLMTVINPASQAMLTDILKGVLPFM